MAESGYTPLSGSAGSPISETPTAYPLTSQEQAIAQRKCKKCGHYYTLKDTPGPCFYHPGEWRELSPHAGALVGWSCCAVSGFVDKYNLISILNTSAGLKDGKGCTMADHHEEDLLYAQATASFPFHPEDVSTQSMRNRLTGETSGAKPVEEKKIEDQRVGTNFIKHAVARTDTLAGLALKYSTSVEAIKRANNMFSDSMSHLDFVMIPLKAGAKPPPKQNEFKYDATVRFIRATGCPQDEAKFYLDGHDYDVDKALAEYKADVRWERTQTPGAN